MVKLERGCAVALFSLGVAGCFMNPDPFAPERSQALTGHNVQSAEQQELIRREQDWQRQQEALEQQQRIERQQREEEQQQQAQNQAPEQVPAAGDAQPVAETVEQSGRTVRRLTPQVRTTPRPALGMPQPGIVLPTVVSPVLGGR